LDTVDLQHIVTRCDHGFTDTEMMYMTLFMEAEDGSVRIEDISRASGGVTSRFYPVLGSLREKLQTISCDIESVRGVGYRFVENT
jgi:DNA-binding response OmpR family regulator